MNIIVRNEEPKDHRRTEEVAREAFWNLYFPVKCSPSQGQIHLTHGGSMPSGYSPVVM